jgi:chromosomal replication initiation ATPase DnaA
MGRQLSLDLPLPGAGSGDADFCVSPSNQAAVTLVTDDSLWPRGKLILAGPPGSGKSHLAGLWAARAGAVTVRAEAWSDPPRGARAVLVEGADTIGGRTEEALFHLHNRLQAAEGRLLLTARKPPGAWSLILPDLASRMQATALAVLGDPDDRLFPALLAKLFADRQIVPAPDLIPWLVRRLERTHRAAIAAVAALDRASLEQGREVNRPLASAVLDFGPSEVPDATSPN